MKPNKFLLICALSLLFLLGCSSSPGIALGELSESNTNVIFVVDVSGTMKGNKIQVTREALKESVRLLPDHANIGILTFNGSLQWLVPLGALNRDFLNRKVDGIRAGGNTAIGDALKMASNTMSQHKQRLKKTTSANFQIVLMTDGMNTSGEDPADIIPKVQQTGQKLAVIGVEFEDDHVRNALIRSGYVNCYHEVEDVADLFATIKEILNIEAVSIGDISADARDLSVLKNIPPEVARALLNAVIAAERKTR